MFDAISKFDCKMRIASAYRNTMPEGLEYLPEYFQVLAAVSPRDYQ